MEIINANEINSLPVATDEECVARRNALIYSGIVRPAGNNDVVKKGKLSVISTKRVNAERRKKLIDQGIINPNPVEISSGVIHPCDKEGSFYKARKIGNNEEYEKRKRAYFRVLQEVLISRRELNLVFNQWDESRMGPKPEGYF